MPGQDQHESGGHRVTVGSADDPRGGATAFVSQQNETHKMTTVYDANGNVVKEVESERGPDGRFRKS
jgi:hypothetical protein